jgi:hypothetical protein
MNSARANFILGEAQSSADIAGRSSVMSMQSDNKGRGLANSLAGQLGLLVAGAIILLVIAWLYVW